MIFLKPSIVFSLVGAVLLLNVEANQNLFYRRRAQQLEQFDEHLDVRDLWPLGGSETGE